MGESPNLVTLSATGAESDSSDNVKNESLRQSEPGLPDFSWYKIPKGERYTKLTRTIPIVPEYNKRP
jgi:hypothetical protein